MVTDLLSINHFQLLYRLYGYSVVFWRTRIYTIFIRQPQTRKNIGFRLIQNWGLILQYIKAKKNRAWGEAIEGYGCVRARYDLRAMVALCNVITEDFISLKSQLSELMMRDKITQHLKFYCQVGSEPLYSRAKY